jgi:tetratricopeptide (TPR) repeat protein
MVQYPALSAFLASRMGAGSSPIRNLRRQVYELGEELRFPVWVAELSARELETYPPEQVQITCLQQARQATDFICVLDGSYGTPWNDAELCVLELEIFAAAMAGKRFHFFKLDPYEPDPRTESLLRAVRVARPDLARAEPQTAKLIVASLRQILSSTRQARRTWRRSTPSLSPASLDVTFLDGGFEPLTDKAPDARLVRSLISQSATAKDEPTRLVYVWMAVRHLCAAPYNDSSFAAYLPLWDAALSRWAAASAWYGLHGHHFLGRLAAVNTLLAVRQRLAETTTAGGTPQSIQGTRGALASEYYSIAKSTGSRKQRRVLLKRALANVDLALQEATSDQSGLIGIRGSILQALGRLREGLSDYRRMFDLRVDNDENEGRIGEAEAELGMGYLRLGHLWLAGRLLAARGNNPENR